jgi:hypothetical protein
MRSQWAEVWKMSLYSILSINTSHNEVISRDVKDVIVLHPLNTYFIQWGHNEKKVCKVSSYSIPLINTSVSEVTMWKCMKGVIVLHPLNKYFTQWGQNQRCERCHCTLPTQYILHTMRSKWEKGMKGVIVLHPLNKYFSQWGHNEKMYERCHRTPSSQ